jgi:hypothetical protein
MLAKAVETFRPTSLLRYAALAGAVVATDSASADAGYDNGTALQRSPRCRGWSRGANRREAARPARGASVACRSSSAMSPCCLPSLHPSAHYRNVPIRRREQAARSPSPLLRDRPPFRDLAGSSDVLSDRGEKDRCKGCAPTKRVGGVWHPCCASWRAWLRAPDRVSRRL